MAPDPKPKRLLSSGGYVGERLHAPAHAPPLPRHSGKFRQLSRELPHPVPLPRPVPLPPYSTTRSLLGTPTSPLLPHRNLPPLNVESLSRPYTPFKPTGAPAA
jgi:hypothetical protein